ncbi:hypothetical protein TFLX_02940 [Thermoflexales bacterium]|nr:hypothetical protein TFLX_02940 [Thermoflexales bacterium]
MVPLLEIKPDLWQNFRPEVRVVQLREGYFASLRFIDRALMTNPSNELRNLGERLAVDPLPIREYRRFIS